MAGGSRFSEADILKLQQKGLSIVDPIIDQRLKKAFGIPKQKVAKKYNNKEKDHIEFVLIALKVGYMKEFKFLENRKFRFDYVIPHKKIAIEYEGIYSSVSRHTTMVGYTNDISKYNLALLNGWKVLRYTSGNYMNFGNDIEILLNK